MHLRIIPGYFSIAFGNFTDDLFPFYEPKLASATGVLTDGDIDAGVVIVGFLLMNWGISFGVSWTGNISQ